MKSNTAPLLWRARHGRSGKGWFSFDVPVENRHPVALWVTYGGEGRRKSTFDILIDGKKIGDYVALPRSPEQDAHFVDANYAIPAELVLEKSKVTVRFQATDGNEIRGILVRGRFVKPKHANSAAGDRGVMVPVRELVRRSSLLRKCRIRLLAIVFVFLSSCAVAVESSKMTVDVSKQGAAVPRGLYGIFSKKSIMLEKAVYTRNL